MIQDIGRKVAKQFEDGVYKGEVISKTGKRGRCLYKILYEDGDGEDLNEKEFKEACMLYDGLRTKYNSETEDSDNDKWSYNSDIEVSEYSTSDEKSNTPAKKTKKTIEPNGKDTEKKPRGKSKKKANTSNEPCTEKFKPIDVKALLTMGTKNSVMGKTLAAMTGEQTSSMISTAEAALQKQAKKLCATML